MPILKYPGAKWRIREWIVAQFPQHSVYLEPFLGSGACFFTKPASKHEILNDLDGHVVNLFQVLRTYPDELARLVNLTPYSRQEFDTVQEEHAGEEIPLTDDPVENARRFLVRCWQGFGSSLADRVGWKCGRDPTAPRNPVIWGGLPEEIIRTAERLKEAQIEQLPATELIRRCCRPDCFIYADPPYPKSVRKKRLYRVEMMEEAAHVELLEALKQHTGTVMISGYDNELYRDMLSGWHMDTHCATSVCSQSRTEVLWMNYKPQMKFQMEQH